MTWLSSLLSRPELQDGHSAPMPRRVNMAQIRDLLRPGLYQAQSPDNRYGFPPGSELDMWVEYSEREDRLIVKWWRDGMTDQIELMTAREVGVEDSPARLFVARLTEFAQRIQRRFEVRKLSTVERDPVNLAERLLRNSRRYKGRYVRGRRPPTRIVMPSIVITNPVLRRPTPDTNNR